jgi:hypothetical protein
MVWWAESCYTVDTRGQNRVTHRIVKRKWFWHFEGCWIRALEIKKKKRREINVIFLSHFIGTLQAEDETRITAEEMTFVRLKIKVKIFPITTMNGYRSRWRGIVNSTFGPFYLHEGTTGTHWIWGWMGSWAGLGVLDKRESRVLL